MPVVLQVPQLEDRNREQDGEPIIQGEIRGEIATSLRHTQVCGAGWDPPKGTKRAGRRAHCATLIIHQQPRATREVPGDWRSSNVRTSYKKGGKEDIGEYRPVRLTLFWERP